MPLRDHFRPPLDDLTSWDGLHGQWPAMIVVALSKRLPSGYSAAPHVHLSNSIEVDVAAFEGNEAASTSFSTEEGGGVALATWAPPRPTLAVSAEPPGGDEYEVRVYDHRRGRRLVAAVEIVSPSNKDRPESRRAFVAKCAQMLQNRVCVAIVDLVTTRSANLYAELLDHLGQTDPALADGPPSLSAASCRWTRGQDSWRFETWAHPLEVGKPMPTLPLWIAENLALPLELEATYEETCRILRLPEAKGAGGQD